MKKNPAKFDRCVKAVKKRGGAKNAYAVCTAAGTRGKKRKGNPAGTSEKAYEEFHGRPSMETVTIKRKVHYHSHLAAAGELQKLVVMSHESGQRVTLKDFEDGDNPAILCFNEKGTQLFIEGGDQRVDLEAFGIDEQHECYVLGEVKVIEYFTRKDHLGSEGGTAIYVHKFERPYPTLMYDSINEQLSFSGGGYTITPEGIDH